MVCHGLTLLLWKNCILLIRRKILTLCAVLLPCLPILLTILMKQLIGAKSERVNATTFEPFNISHEHLLNRFASLKILYTPSNNVTDTIMALVKRQIIELVKANPAVAMRTIEFEKWKNESEIENNLLTHINLDLSCAVIFLTDFSGINLDYKLRFPQSELNYIDKIMKQSQINPGPTDENSNYGSNPGYFSSGFISLQSAIDKAIITYVNGKTSFSELLINNEMHVNYNRMPYPTYAKDSALTFLQAIFSTLIIISFMIIVVQVARNIVLEKEKRLKEALKIMGITNATHWMAWFITFFILTTITVSLIVFLLCMPLTSYGSILKKTNPFLLFMFLETYSITMITFAFAASVSFSKATTASTIVAFVFFLTFLPKFAISNETDVLIKTLLCIIPNVGLGVGMDIICYLELYRSGLTWKALIISVESIKIITVITVFVITSVFFMVVTLYQELVWPGEYGIPLPWYFPIKKKFWTRAKFVSEISYDDTDIEPSRKKYFEDELKSKKAGIQIRQLKKVFYPAGKMRIAVNNLSMTLYQGNITVLLGHNGAGKTTTMSILTGFLPPTEGTAYILGLDIRHDMEKIRKKLGLCPQYDILFDDLTVEEHMKLFTKLKGYKGSELKEEIESKLKSVNLLHKKKAQSKTLSGGMKRRLSIAMALTGGSEIVIMDEPTSGLDPHARHEMWTLLQKERKNRTILLSTHFMDEAEILGDRIGIMANGSLLCYGSPMFLKKAYGAEYRLTFVKNKNFDLSLLHQCMHSFVPEHRLEGDISDDVTYCLPTSASHKFPELFETLEKKLTEFGISSFGASIANIEQVFLKAENYEDISVDDESPYDDKFQWSPQKSSKSKCSLQNDDSDESSSLYQNEGFQLYWQQTYHILLKNIHYTLQHKISTIIYTIVPPLIFLMAFIGDDNGASYLRRNSPMTMNFTVYSGNILTYREVNLKNARHQIYVKEFLNYFTTHSSSSIESISKTSLNSYLTSKGEEDLTYYIEKYLFGLEFTSTFVPNITHEILLLSAYFNHEDIHTPGIIQNFISNVLLRMSGKKFYIINTISHTLPKATYDVADRKVFSKIQKAMYIAICLIFGIAFFISTFSVPIIEERISKVKQLQYLSGCKTVSYWLGIFIHNFIHIFVVSMLMIIVICVFKQYAYISNARFLMMFMFFIIFTFAAMPQIYLLCNLFSNASSGAKWLTTIISISSILVFILVSLTKTSLLSNGIFKYCFPTFAKLLFPVYAFAQGFHDIYLNHAYMEYCSGEQIKKSCEAGHQTSCCNCSQDCFSFNKNYFGWTEPGIGQIFLFLILQGIFYWAFIYFLETSFFENLKIRIFNWKNNCFDKQDDDDDDSEEDEDEDVMREKGRVNYVDVENLACDESLVLKNVSKSYGKFKAVDGITIGVKPGICFGLLGINGAGKSTTFKMMTGETRPTTGEIYINSYNLATEFNEARKCIGFCPQEHVLINELTARQQLTLYFNLRGFESDFVPYEVDKLMELINLTSYADEPCGKYSGGNKRKLNTAIALVGNPELVFLDEPTSGMDPGARRHLWNTLTKYKSRRKTVILTSHSMEECEVLCNQVVIMVNGHFQCLGSIQHLKSKFAEGYTVLIQIEYPDEIEGKENAERLLNFMNKFTDDFIIIDQRQSYLNLHFNKSDKLSWSKLFRLFESIREQMKIIHYSVSQASLESVFMRFANNQIPPVLNQSKSGKCCCCCKLSGNVQDDETPRTSSSGSESSRSETVV